MDALISATLGSLPQLGGAGLLVFLVLLILRREGQELAREREAHRRELDERDEEIEALRARLAEAQAEIDEQRRMRRLAEDWAARMARMMPSEAPTWPG